jgi:hypothetical protein
MTDPNQHLNPDPDVTNPEVEYGGADAIEKTTYVVGSGTDPDAERINRPAPLGITGTNPVFWGALALAILVAAIYFVALAS